MPVYVCVPSRRGGGDLVHAKFGMAKLGAEKIWHQVLNTTETFGTKFPDRGTTSIDRERCYFLWAFGWLLLFLGGFWMVVVSLHAKSAKNDTEKIAMGLKIPWHNLAHFVVPNFAIPNFGC